MTNRVTDQLIKERPMRGREMRTKVVPDEMFDSMKLVSAKKTLKGDLTSELEKTPSKSDKGVSLYHEGYVDDKLYLVPDENLEFMKDDIDTRIRLRGLRGLADGYEKESYDVTDYDRAHRRIGTLLSKADELQSISESEEESSKEEEEEEEIEENEGAVEHAEEEKEKVPEDENGDVEKVEEEETPEEEKLNNEEPLPPATVPKSEFVPDRQDSLRLLVSGHFRKDQKPIYIIQEYTEDHDLFKDQKAEFRKKIMQTEEGIDISISGRFYDETILEEGAGKPVALNVGPYRIMVDEKRSNVYDDYFEQSYTVKAVDCLLRGEFLKSKITERITPFLSIAVSRDLPPKENNSPGNANQITNKNNPATTVFACKLKPTVPFPDKRS